MATTPFIDASIDHATAIDIQALCRRYVDTFASKKADLIVALHAEDGVLWVHSGRPQARGRSAIATMLQGFFDQWPELGFEIHRTMFTDRAWILDWSVTAVLRDAAGGPRPVSFHAADIVEVDAEGLVVRKDTYIDLAEVKAALEG